MLRVLSTARDVDLADQFQPFLGSAERRVRNENAADRGSLCINAYSPTGPLSSPAVRDWSF